MFGPGAHNGFNECGVVIPLWINRFVGEVAAAVAGRKELKAAGDIALNDAATAIEGVVVSAERPVVRVEEGKLSYDLGAATKGMAVNNAYEAIERLPGGSTQDGRRPPSRESGGPRRGPGA